MCIEHMGESNKEHVILVPLPGQSSPWKLQEFGGNWPSLCLEEPINTYKMDRLLDCRAGAGCPTTPLVTSSKLMLLPAHEGRERREGGAGSTALAKPRREWGYCATRFEEEMVLCYRQRKQEERSRPKEAKNSQDISLSKAQRGAEKPVGIMV